MIYVAMDPNSPTTGFLAPFRRYLKHLFLRFIVWSAHRLSPNPSRKWVRTPGLELVLDLDRNTFCGVGFGHPYGEFSFLGPCDEFNEMDCQCVDPAGNLLGGSTKSYSLSYNSDGFDIGANEERIVENFSIQFDLFPDELGFLKRVPDKAYAGKILLNAQEIDYTTLRSVDSLIRYFGAPDEDNESPAHDTEIEGETVPQSYSRMLVYMRPSATWMFFVGEAGNVWTMYVSPPMPTRRARCDGPECDTHAH